MGDDFGDGLRLRATHTAGTIVKGVWRRRYAGICYQCSWGTEWLKDYQQVQTLVRRHEQEHVIRAVPRRSK